MITITNRAIDFGGNLKTQNATPQSKLIVNECVLVNKTCTKQYNLMQCISVE